MERSGEDALWGKETTCGWENERENEEKRTPGHKDVNELGYWLFTHPYSQRDGWLCFWFDCAYGGDVVEEATTWVSPCFTITSACTYIVRLTSFHRVAYLLFNQAISWASTRPLCANSIDVYMGAFTTLTGNLEVAVISNVRRLFSDCELARKDINWISYQAYMLLGWHGRTRWSCLLEATLKQVSSVRFRVSFTRQTWPLLQKL